MASWCCRAQLRQMQAHDGKDYAEKANAILMSILSFNNLSLIMAGNAILTDVDWQIQPKSRIALVGRNGAGKSTLLKLLQGDLVQDSGQMHRMNGLRVAGLTQDVPVTADETVYHFLVKCLGDLGEVLTRFREASFSDDTVKIAKSHQDMDDRNAWELLPKIESFASRLDLQPDASMNQLSGGMKRRALLAAALIASPDLLLLDEPTNHLDMQAIIWLEGYLKNYSGTVLLVTHDREFLSQVANSIVEIDRGHLQVYDCDYETFLDRREANRLAALKHEDLFDKRLEEEEVWIRTGVKARRTRNEGRVRALKAMREEHRQRRLQAGKVKSLDWDVARSGNVVLEAKKLNYSIAGKAILRDFSFLLTRGDKVGIIGPNGCGKTTLVRLLLGELTANSGELRQGTSIEVAYFDQLRRELDEKQTVMANVADGADHVVVQGKQKHVASYLRDFLFEPVQFNQPVSSLSGGERNRLLLAKLLAKPVNLLVMDEPTNDLDIETLELLETILVDYPGTLLLISHDRAFINHVVTSVLVFEGNGRFEEFVGGFDDYSQHQKQQQKQQQKVPASSSPSPRRSSNAKLSFQEERELSQLPKQIENLEAKIEALHAEMAIPTFYEQEKETINVANQKLAGDEATLSYLYSRWESLEAKKVQGS